MLQSCLAPHAHSCKSACVGWHMCEACLVCLVLPLQANQHASCLTSAGQSACIGWHMCEACLLWHVLPLQAARAEAYANLTQEEKDYLEAQAREAQELEALMQVCAPLYVHACLLCCLYAASVLFVAFVATTVAAAAVPAAVVAIVAVTGGGGAAPVSAVVCTPFHSCTSACACALSLPARVCRHSHACTL